MTETNSELDPQEIARLNSVIEIAEKGTVSEPGTPPSGGDGRTYSLRDFCYHFFNKGQGDENGKIVDFEVGCRPHASLRNIILTRMGGQEGIQDLIKGYELVRLPALQKAIGPVFDDYDKESQKGLSGPGTTKYFKMLEDVKSIQIFVNYLKTLNGTITQENIQHAQELQNSQRSDEYRKGIEEEKAKQTKEALRIFESSTITYIGPRGKETTMTLAEYAGKIGKKYQPEYFDQMSSEERNDLTKSQKKLNDILLKTFPNPEDIHLLIEGWITRLRSSEHEYDELKKKRIYHEVSKEEEASIKKSDEEVSEIRSVLLALRRVTF